MHKKTKIHFLISNSAVRIPHLIKFLIPRSAFRIPHFSKGQQKIAFVFALVILALLYFKFYYRSPSPPEEVYKEVLVEVLGEVQKPGIYLFKLRPTLKEAIERAGGLMEPALFDMATSSQPLETGSLINVARGLQKVDHVGISQDVIKIKLGRMEANKLLVFSIPLDLNRISGEDLCLVPGIGESLAREIVAYRQRRRGFRSVEELKNVKGIGDKKWKAFKTFFIVTQPLRVESS